MNVPEPNVVQNSQMLFLFFRFLLFGFSCVLGSHVESVNAVVKGSIDCAAIDCITLQMILKKQPNLEEEIHVVTSLGPFPVPPIIVNRRLPREYLGTQHIISSAGFIVD